MLTLVEIYQNCNVFNDGAFEVFTGKDGKKVNTLKVEHDKPLIFGAENEKGIKLDGLKPVVVNVADVSENDLWIHDEKDKAKANLLVRFFDDMSNDGSLPRPFGVFYQEGRFCYEDALIDQINAEVDAKGEGDLDALLRGKNTWTI